MTHRKHNVRTAEEETFGLFWDEYRSIEQTPGSPGPSEEETNAKDGKSVFVLLLLFISPTLNCKLHNLTHPPKTLEPPNPPRLYPLNNLNTRHLSTL